MVQVDSHISGADKVSIKSGGDTNILGGVVKGNRVVTDIGGDLNIESRQDTARYDSKQQSLGGSASVGAGKVGGSLSVSQSQVNADYASVNERSGIQAGDGGFDVKVKGKTDLVGGAISSTQKAVDEGRNSFDTKSLTTSDIQNRDNFNASGFSLSGGYSTGGTGQPGDGGKPAPNLAGGANGAAAGIASASGKNSSTTTSGISGIAGDKEVRTGDGSGGLAKTFDADKVNKEVAAQLQTTSTFGQQAAKAAGDFANGKAKELRAEGKEEEARRWDEGGEARSAVHAVIGALTGGVGGALGAGAAALSADAINQAVAGLPAGLKEAVGGAIAVAIGGVAGGGAGVTTAFNSDFNNRQLHPTEVALAKNLAVRSDGRYTEEQMKEQMRLMGNAAFSEGPNMLNLATTNTAVQQSIMQDPDLPRNASGNLVFEVAGHTDIQIQKYIIAGSTADSGFIPGQSPYISSNPSLNLPAKILELPKFSAVARCANGDESCASGIGIKTAPMTLEQKAVAANYFGALSSQYSRAASLAAMTEAVPIASAYGVASVAAGLLEQAFMPSLGKVVVDSIFLDNIAEITARRRGAPLFMVNEIVDAYIRPKFAPVKDAVDSAVGMKK